MPEDSDDEKPASKEVETGWGSWYNQVLGVGPEKEKRKASAGVSPATGWLSGLLGGTVKEPEEKDHGSEPDEDDPAVSSLEAHDPKPGDSSDGDSVKDSGEQDPEAGEGESEHSEEEPSDDESHVSGLNASGGEEMQESNTNPSPCKDAQTARRDKSRNAQQFGLPAPAAELAVPDQVVLSQESQPPLLGFWSGVVTWWSSAPAVVPATATVDLPVVAPPMPVPSDPAAAARQLLPQVPDPPTYRLEPEQTLNTFFFGEPDLSLLGPRRFPQYEGRLRGWPRAVAPRWSSAGVLPDNPYTCVRDGAEALNLFRVS